MRGVQHMAATHLFFPGLLLVGQLLSPKPTLQHVTVVTTVTATGARMVLQLDVTPKANIHVYGPGAKDFTQPALKIAVEKGMTVEKISFPAPELVLDPILKERIPMYSKTFRVTQPVTFAAVPKPGTTITGVLIYQACDDKMCFPPASLPITGVLK